MDDTCRLFASRMSDYAYAEKPKVTNRYPAICGHCGDRLLPGEGVVSNWHDGKIKWSCGPNRARREGLRL